MRRKLFVMLATALGTIGLTATGAAAAPGSNQDVIDASPAFACEGDAGLPPAHCVNIKGRGDTGLILVFQPDARAPQESFSFNPKADSRPCPHDPDADPDGTWWQVPDGPYVCHHKP